MNIDAAYIKQLNEKVGTLNMERQRQIGAVETAKKTFEAGLAQYNQTYGTQLTVDTLQAELDKVSATLANDAAEVERIIKTIEDGSYKANTTTAVTVTASDGVLLQDAPKMPSTPINGQGGIGTAVPPQNAATGVVAPSTVASVPAVENAATGAVGVGNNSQPFSAPTTQSSGGILPIEQSAEFDTFAPAAGGVNAAAQPPTEAPAFPNMGSPAPVESSGGQMMFGVEIPAATMTTPGWAQGVQATQAVQGELPTTGEGINAQFSEMLGGRFSG